MLYIHLWATEKSLDVELLKQRSMCVFYISIFWNCQMDIYFLNVTLSSWLRMTTCILSNCVLLHLRRWRFNQHGWGGGGRWADSPNGRDGGRSLEGRLEELKWSKEPIGSMPNAAPFHHRREANSRRHCEHSSDQKGRREEQNLP